MDLEEEDELFSELCQNLDNLVDIYQKKGLQLDQIVWSSARYSMREIAKEFIQQDQSKMMFLDYIHQLGEVSWMEAKENIRTL